MLLNNEIVYPAESKRYDEKVFDEISLIITHVWLKAEIATCCIEPVITS